MESLSMLIEIQLYVVIFSPWQWFVSTRAFSNTLETALTAMALYYWPWEWMKPTSTGRLREQDTQKYDTNYTRLYDVLLLTDVKLKMEYHTSSICISPSTN